ncbi:MAG: hypothetical protein J6C33_02985 [Lachnospiraceae bacterium]|nr:hypothetical protein [Lachnospiraceae bacterium]
MGKKEKDQKIQTKYLPTKFTLTVRVLVGAYLLYTSYSLIDGVVSGEGRDKYFFGIFMIAFAIIGILLILFAGCDLLRGKYVDGAMDAGEETEENKIEENGAEALEEDARSEKEDKPE